MIFLIIAKKHRCSKLKAEIAEMRETIKNINRIVKGNPKLFKEMYKQNDRGKKWVEKFD